MSGSNGSLHPLASAPEPSAGPNAPSPAHPVRDGAVCACGAPPHASLADRCAGGHLAAGNSLARRTSLYAASGTPETEAIEASARAMVEQSFADAGGATELIARVRADHEYRGVIDVQIKKLARALSVYGEFDKRGRLRKGWIELLDRLVNTAVSIDKTLGLARKQKQVPSLAEYLEKSYPANKLEAGS